MKIDAGDRIPLRILLAEDNPANQEIVVRWLEREGHSVVVAATGAEVIRAVAAARFDVVLMNLDRPVLNGYEAARGIRAGERVTGRHVPVIALTADPVRSLGAMRTAGMDDYLSKPIRSRELYAALARWSRTSRLEALSA